MHEKVLQEERRRAIARWTREQGRVTIAEIRARFGVSEATARRDLEALARAGLIERVRGGALPRQIAPPEPPFLQRQHEQSAAKARIAEVAASLVEPGETVFLGSGTTVLEVARHLQHKPGLTVITNSLPVLNLLASVPDITLVSLGGVLRPKELSFIGHLTEQALREMRAQKVIMGIRGITPDELTNDYLPETLTDRAILQMGQQIFIVADHTKLGAVAPVRLASIDVVDVLITDRAADPRLVEAFRARGLQVLLA